MGTIIQTPSPEPRDDPPSCFSCSEMEASDQVCIIDADVCRLCMCKYFPLTRAVSSVKDSDHSSDDLSSGVFSSCNSQTDGHVEWTASANQPSSLSLEGRTAELCHQVTCGLTPVITVFRCSGISGVDIWIEDMHGECLRIRERRQVKVGHVAIGISDQVRYDMIDC